MSHRSAGAQRSAATRRPGRPSRPPGARFGRPAPAPARRRSAPGTGIAGLVGGGARKKRSGGGIGKGAGGLAALAGLAGLAVKNRDKITGKLGRGRRFEAEGVAPATTTAPGTEPAA